MLIFIQTKVTILEYLNLGVQGIKKIKSVLIKEDNAPIQIEKVEAFALIHNKRKILYVIGIKVNVLDNRKDNAQN